MYALAGLLWGYDDAEDDEAKKQLYALVQKLSADFKADFGTISCRDLLKGIAAGTTPTPTKRDEEFYKVRPCVAFVEKAAQLIDKELEARKAL